jgi:hypothetical protein
MNHASYKSSKFKILPKCRGESVFLLIIFRLTRLGVLCHTFHTLPLTPPPPTHTHTVYIFVQYPFGESINAVVRICLEAIFRSEHADDSLLSLAGSQQNVCQTSNDHFLLNGCRWTQNLTPNNQNFENFSFSSMYKINDFWPTFFLQKSNDFKL